ncbi:M56 family metallopeptidase [Rufibacter sp. LB8]|uniref:M56 family metallopeptidase n=2 Tax=Bacteria TaxID=2 RepID=UPI00178C21DB|nr:M56 family metallopeptidase [Rufibacter sp. LB8]
MPKLLLYLLQVNVGLVLLYLLYQLALRQTTFYTWNRFFLLAGLVLTAVLPLVDFEKLFLEQPQLYQTISIYVYAWPAYEPVTQETAFDYGLIPVWLFWLGFCVMAVRFCVQLASLYSIHRKSAPKSYQGIAFREVAQDLPPFSFGTTIYFSAQRHPQEDWLAILKHEHTHVRQLHTLDILLVEMLTLVHWFNPVIWQLRKALKQNLEFLTDQQTVQAGIDRKRYQFSLLQTARASPFSLSASFSYHSLKHRIMMMNKTPSARVQALRFLVAIPLLGLSLVSLQLLALENPAELLQQAAQNKPSKALATDQPEDYDTFMARNPTVKRLGWNKENFYVHLKSGKTETYPRTKQGLASATKKYGTLPPPPPPPPPPPYRKDWPKDFLARNPSVKGFTSSEGTFYIILKNGEVETFDQTKEGVAALEKKYGSLPAPPPPVRKKAAPAKKKNSAGSVKFMPPVVKPQAGVSHQPLRYNGAFQLNPTC